MLGQQGAQKFIKFSGSRAGPIWVRPCGGETQGPGRLATGCSALGSWTGASHVLVQWGGEGCGSPRPLSGRAGGFARMVEEGGLGGRGGEGGGAQWAPPAHRRRTCAALPSTCHPVLRRRVGGQPRRERSVLGEEGGLGLGGRAFPSSDLVVGRRGEALETGRAGRMRRYIGSLAADKRTVGDRYMLGLVRDSQLRARAMVATLRRSDWETHSRFQHREFARLSASGMH